MDSTKAQAWARHHSEYANGRVVLQLALISLEPLHRLMSRALAVLAIGISCFSCT